MITCGIISPEVQEQLPSHCHGDKTGHPAGGELSYPHGEETAGGGEDGGAPLASYPPHDPSRFKIDVTPPSMSSTGSSTSGSSSPIAIDPERLVLPFDDCPEDFE